MSCAGQKLKAESNCGYSHEERSEADKPDPKKNNRAFGNVLFCHVVFQVCAGKASMKVPGEDKL